MVSKKERKKGKRQKNKQKRTKENNVKKQTKEKDKDKQGKQEKIVNKHRGYGAKGGVTEKVQMPTGKEHDATKTDRWYAGQTRWMADGASNRLH